MGGTTRPLVKSIFRALAAVSSVSTLLPLSRSRLWWVRSLDFPRLQIAALGAVALAACLMSRHGFRRFDSGLAGLVAASVLFQLKHFAKYTPLTRKQVLRKPAAKERLVRVLIANVRMRNPSADRLLAVAARRDPDLLLLLEPNQRWLQQLSPLRDRYPHQILCPLENTYGMLLFSRLPLVEPQVRFLIQDDIPSIQTRVRLPNGRLFRFYGVHPRPPVRGSADGEIELPGSAPRDAELVVLAMELHNSTQPVLVAGDFNDVAWSHTTRRFQRLSRTLDPRVGRGLFSTFHAGNRLLRFPLDHMFVSEHFALGEFAREGDIGSDHFPLYAELIMDPSAPDEQEPPSAEKKDFLEARDDLVAAGDLK